jgi:hypothetical protein
MGITRDTEEKRVLGIAKNELSALASRDFSNTQSFSTSKRPSIVTDLME